MITETISYSVDVEVEDDASDEVVRDIALAVFTNSDDPWRDFHGEIDHRDIHT
jgi:hypothetical protein